MTPRHPSSRCTRRRATAIGGGAFIAEQAKKELGVQIRFVSGGGGDLTERLIGEKNNAQADVALGLGESLLYRLDAEEVFTPFSPTWGSDIPSQFTLGTDGFTLFSQTPIVMAYNTDALAPSEATQLTALPHSLTRDNRNS